MKYTMTPGEFVFWSEGVFGAYTPGMKLEVQQWLADKDGHFIAGLRQVALREHPSVYGKPPGVHELEEMKISAYSEGHALEARQIEGQGQRALPDLEAVDGDAMFAEARKQLGWDR